jgi:hypothetical protein
MFLAGMMFAGTDGVRGWSKYWREVVAVLAGAAGHRWSGWCRGCLRRADRKGAGAWLCLVYTIVLRMVETSIISIHCCDNI